MKKKTVKRYIAWAALVCLVAVLAVMPLLAAKEQEADGPQASILSATVHTENVDVTLKGGGTLSAGNAMDVTIPSGVKITEFLVSNGDAVTEGTPVARVDPVSVMNAIVAVRETMDYIQDQIMDARDDTIASTVRAPAGGKVKQVFANKGDSVQDVMLRHGALAVLSLDGQMAVTIQRDTDLRLGDTVCVTPEGGKEVVGRVESSLNGTLVVTVPDDNYAVGHKVTVTTEDGEALGTGELSVHNAWLATGYSGTIQTVYIKENQTLSDGASLFYLKDTDFTGYVDTLSGLHREYEALLQDLFRMYETEVLTAPCDGIVSGVVEDSPHLLSSQGGYRIQLLSDTSTPVCDGTDKTGENCKAETHMEGCIYHCTEKADCPTINNKKHKLTCLSLCISAQETGKCVALNHKETCIEKCSSETELGKCKSQVHKPDCIETCVPSDGTADCPSTVHRPECLERCDKKETCTATTHHYPECLTLCDGSEECPALCHKETCYMASLQYYAYAALVRQVGTTDLIVAADTETVYKLKTGGSGWTLVEPTSIKTDLMLTERTISVGGASSYRPGDIILLWTGYIGDEAVKSGVAVYSKAPAPAPGTTPDAGMLPGMYPNLDMSTIMGMMGGFNMSGFSMGGMAVGSGAGSTPELFDLNGEVLLTVTDHSAMTLTITLDEQDIAKVHPGQIAQVKVNALKGDPLEAEVTQVGTFGTNAGGSSKFTVELTMPYREEMLAGMHATATIPLYTQAEVSVIPVAALYEQPGKTIVYTALDPETGDPASPVEVTTGVSDGERVEITAGLNPGDTVYYSYYDILELDHTAKADAVGPFAR